MLGFGHPPPANGRTSPLKRGAPDSVDDVPLRSPVVQKRRQGSSAKKKIGPPSVGARSGLSKLKLGSSVLSSPAPKPSLSKKK